MEEAEKRKKEVAELKEHAVTKNKELIKKALE